jgi:hypothetical protein
MSADHLTKPERSCSRQQGRDVRDAVTEDGGCCYCKHRSGLFAGIGRIAACGLTTPKAFPACVDGAGGFTFDEPAFREARWKPTHSMDSGHD